MVLGLADVRHVGLLSDSHGAGGGQGPNPLAKPPGAAPAGAAGAGDRAAVDVDFPLSRSYGGVETTDLELPVGQWVEFHVTSLDVDPQLLGVRARRQGGRDPGQPTTSPTSSH